MCMREILFFFKFVDETLFTVRMNQEEGTGMYELYIFSYLMLKQRYSTSQWDGHLNE